MRVFNNFDSIFKILTKWGVFVGLIAASQNTKAGEDPNSFAGRSRMLDYRLADFANFEKNWTLVTVRFRKDTNEMRFTYANSLAYESLQRGAFDYPKGSIFAKIGFITQEDSAFPSSAVPSGKRRYQFMIRDKDKYNRTAGWGYLLFDSNGLTFPEDPKRVVAACAACHGIVPQRGFVFSQLMEKTPFTVSTLAASARSTSQKIATLAQNKFENSPAPIQFKTVKRVDLPQEIQNLVPQNFLEVNSVSGELQNNLFQGTLDEIRPFLAHSVSSSNKPAILMSIDGKRFSLIWPVENKNCPAKTTVELYALNNINFKNNEKYETQFCWPIQ